MFQFKTITDYINTIDRLRISLSRRVDELEKQHKKIGPTFILVLDNADVVMIILLMEITKLSIRIDNLSNLHKFVALDSIQCFLNDISQLTTRLKNNN